MYGGSVWLRRLGRLAATCSALAVAGGCSDGKSAAREGAWEFNVDTVRSGTAADARPTAWLRTTGKEGAQGQPPTRAVILSFDCRPDHTGATIMTEQALRQGSVEVEVGLDAERPRRVPGFAGTTPTGGQVVFTMPLDSVVDLVSGHQRATIEYADGAGSSRTTAVFPLAGLEVFRERFLAVCAHSGPDSDGR